MVGQAPSKETEGEPPFSGKCGKFLAELMSLTQEEMLAQHDFVNVFDRWPGKGINGDKFPFPEAELLAKRLLPQLQGRTVVLLGANVARAFGAKGFAYFQCYELRDPSDPTKVVSPLIAVVPHPSGVNRLYNQPQKRLDAAKLLKSLAARP
jgi:uracil-DNA glycosylase